MMNKYGVLVIGHGSSKAEWVSRVEDVVDEARTKISLPLELSFLEMVEGRLIPDGIQKLDQVGVTDIIVVPLFVASGSTHLDEIRYMLGIMHETPEFAPEMAPLKLSARIHFCKPMNDHPYILEILKERIAELSDHPEQEVPVLVGHGADEGKYFCSWQKLMGRMKIELRKHFSFPRIAYATYHPNNIREKVQEVGKGAKPLVIPLFLSEGYFTRKVIPSQLEGLTYAYTGHTYLPHPNVSRWLVDTITKKLDEVSNEMRGCRK
jgi:sirohydrochlorin cobaltochelatase